MESQEPPQKDSPYLQEPPPEYLFTSPLPSPGQAGSPPPPPKPKRWRRYITKRVVGIAVSVVVAVAIVCALVIRLPYDVLEPGEAPDAGSLVTINAPTHQRAGSIHLLTAEITSGVTLPKLIQAELTPGDGVYPSSAYPQTSSQESIAMDESEHDGEVAAFGELYGYQHLQVDGYLVVALAAEAPASKVLKGNDVITSADGVSLTSAATASSALQAAIQNHAAGASVHLTVLRAGATLTVDVPVMQDPQPPPDPARIIGVEGEPDFVIPVGVKINAGSIGGPSAGLSWALSIIQALGPVDLTRGRTIADTGQIDFAGNITAIGGVAQKVYGAQKAGATIFVCPNDGNNAADAEAVVKANHFDMKVIGVTTLHQAVEALAAP